MRHRTLILFLFVLLMGRTFAAPKTEDPNVTKAKALYKSGLVNYRLQQLDSAITDFEAAYRLWPDPSLLFNLAQAHRLSGHYDRALFLYKGYLNSAAPTGTLRTEIEERIAALEKQIAAQKAAASRSDQLPSPNEPTRAGVVPPVVAAPPVPKAPTGSPRRAYRIVGPVFLGVGVAGVAAGAGLLGAAASVRSDIEKPGSTFNPDDETRMRNFQAAGYALLGVGAAGLAAGAALTVLGYRRHHEAAVIVTPLAGREVVGISAVGAF